MGIINARNSQKYLKTGNKVFLIYLLRVLKYFTRISFLAVYYDLMINPTDYTLLEAK